MNRLKMWVAIAAAGAVLSACGGGPKQPDWIMKGSGAFKADKKVFYGVGIADAREYHGSVIHDTEQHTNDDGLANSAARLLPEGTVCVSRTASVGYVVVLGRPMATSQDFVNWVCADKLQPDFLKYLILAEGREGLLRYASGAVHQTIYFPEAKAFHICYPEPKEQLRIVRQCDELREETQRLARLYERKHAALEALKKSLLHQAFTGEL